MIKTLYVRVVLTYIAAVLLGVICSFFISVSITALLKEQFNRSTLSSLNAEGEKLIYLFQQTGLAEADTNIRSMNMLKNYEITLFDSKGAVKSYGPFQDKFFMNVSAQDIAHVLDGETVRSSMKMRDKAIVGLPLSIGAERYALFLQPSSLAEEKMAWWIIFFSLAIVLLTGSLFIVIAARYLVRPLKKMKEATRRIAAGDFQIDLEFGQVKRKDELSDLAQSFGHMAREIQRMEEMRQDFVSNVSHEIQSPLTSISGFSKVLRRGGLSEEERNHYLDIIQSHSERLSRLGDNLLKLASYDSLQHPFEPRTFDLDEQIRSIVVAFEPQWSAKAIQLELDLPRVKICADEDQLSQIWMNLLGNAIKFTPHGGCITMSIMPLTNRIEVVIADTGIGIAKDDLHRIFERFFQADRSHTVTNAGSGLGLAIVKSIVKRNGGTIQVESEIGRGTTFTVDLPSSPPPDKAKRQ